MLCCFQATPFLRLFIKLSEFTRNRLLIISNNIDKKVEKPYNAANARHVNFPKFGEKGRHIIGVRQLLQTVYIQSPLSVAVLPKF